MSIGATDAEAMAKPSVWRARDPLRQAIGLLPYTTGIAAGVSLSLVSIKLWRQQNYPYFAPVAGIALAVFVAACIVAFVCSRRQIAWPRWMDRAGCDGMGARFAVWRVVARRAGHSSHEKHCGR